MQSEMRISCILSISLPDDDKKEIAPKEYYLQELM